MRNFDKDSFDIYSSVHSDTVDASHELGNSDIRAPHQRSMIYESGVMTQDNTPEKYHESLHGSNDQSPSRSRAHYLPIARWDSSANLQGSIENLHPNSDPHLHEDNIYKVFLDEFKKKLEKSEHTLLSEHFSDFDISDNSAFQASYNEFRSQYMLNECNTASGFDQNIWEDKVTNFLNQENTKTQEFIQNDQNLIQHANSNNMLQGIYLGQLYFSHSEICSKYSIIYNIPYVGNYCRDVILQENVNFILKAGIMPSIYSTKSLDINFFSKILSLGFLGNAWESVIINDNSIYNKIIATGLWSGAALYFTSTPETMKNYGYLMFYLSHTAFNCVQIWGKSYNTEMYNSTIFQSGIITIKTAFEHIANPSVQSFYQLPDPALLIYYAADIVDLGNDYQASYIDNMLGYVVSGVCLLTSLKYSKNYIFGENDSKLLKFAKVSIFASAVSNFTTKLANYIGYFHEENSQPELGMSDYHPHSDL